MTQQYAQQLIPANPMWMKDIMIARKHGFDESAPIAPLIDDVVVSSKPSVRFKSYKVAPSLITLPSGDKKNIDAIMPKTALFKGNTVDVAPTLSKDDAREAKATATHDKKRTAAAVKAEAIRSRAETKARIEAASIARRETDAEADAVEKIRAAEEARETAVAATAAARAARAVHAAAMAAEAAHNLWAAGEGDLSDHDSVVSDVEFDV
jgi:hypothetical protein